jgi:hypothetical protein
MNEEYINVEAFLTLAKFSTYRVDDIFNRLKRYGFDSLDTSDYMFLIKVYIANIINLYDDPDEEWKRELAIRRLKNKVKRSGLDILNYSNNDYKTVAVNSREFCRNIINLYKNLKLDNDAWKKDHK